MTRVRKQEVLVFTSDRGLYAGLEPALHKAGFKVSTASTTAAISEIRPDFILLDSKNQDIGGRHFCSSVHGELHLPETRIIILSDSADPSDRTMALNLGAHDYMLQPINTGELLEKIAVLQRRRGVDRLQQIRKAGKIEMIPEQWVVYVDSLPIELTETEYRLLQELLEVEGRVLTRQALMERVWGHEKACNLESRTLDVHMSRLRHKLGSSAKNIVTVRNVGYRINVSADQHRLERFN